ncbi:MAG: class I SAM-dependent rRNA methyltransferase [Gammaproteobacteria bacterium]
MYQLPILRLKKNEDRRLRAGHLWVYSNEIDIKTTPLKSFTPGQEVRIEAHDKTPLGNAYVNPHSLISARIYSRKLSQRLDLAFLTDKITSALALRERLYDKPYFRLVFGESDGLPGLVVDRFADDLSVQINTAGMDTKTDVIIEALRTVLPQTRSILLRNDSPARLQEGLENTVTAGFGVPPEKVLLEENSTSFYAPLWAGQKTGWFYDHRANRARMHDYVANLRILDVFSYLGGWGVQAAKFGAKQIVCIDASPLATDAILSNAELNHVADRVQVICDDAFDALKNLHQDKEKFDVIILDPPAFAKKLKDKKEGLIAYQRINELALKLLVPDGILVSCSCSMHITMDDLLQAVRRASFQTQCEVQILERGHQAPDHPMHIAIPETDYLKMLIGRKLLK